MTTPAEIARLAAASASGAGLTELAPLLTGDDPYAGTYDADAYAAPPPLPPTMPEARTSED